MLQIKQLTLTTAQIAALNVDDLQILPAPPAGFTYVIYRVEASWGAGSTAWFCAGNILVGGTAYDRNWSLGGGTFSNVTQKVNLTAAFGEPQSNQTDFRIFASDAITGGDRSLIIDVAYDTVPIV